jgi:Ca2+-binding RTX toxin-like protein
MKGTSSIVAAVGLALAIPGVAAAETASVFGTDPFATIRAAPGEFNALHVDRIAGAGGALEFWDDNVALTPGRGCRTQPSGRVTCDDFSADAHLGDAPDTATVRVNARARVWGGAGDDTLDADSFGGSTEVHGDGGDDTVSAGGEGGQIADGGAGDDTLFSGGFAGAATAIGGSGDDVIHHSTGLGGSADIDAGPGDDIVVSRPVGSGTASGGPGDDMIIISGPLPPSRTSSPFTLTAGDGNDVVVGGPSGDTIDAGAGRDYVDVSGGGADTVSCGAGIDVVRSDASDTIAPDCEITLP